jgi:plasmid replication initiation protein
MNTPEWNFKRRVLDIAIDQINEFSDINLKYEQHKVAQFQVFHSVLNKRNQLIAYRK